MTSHEIVIRLGRPFDIRLGNGAFLADVREVTVTFNDRESAELALREVQSFVRPVHDAGGEDYRPVVAGEVVKQPAGITSSPAWRPVVKCLNCGGPVHQRAQPAWQRPTVIVPLVPQDTETLPRGLAAFSPATWVHWGFWQGIRCPGCLTGAEPGGEFAEDEYWAWVDEQIKARRGSADA